MDMAHERDASSEEEVMAGELRRGPWTVEEDLLLVNYVASHGEGRWNSLARSAGGIHAPCRITFWVDYLSELHRQLVHQAQFMGSILSTSPTDHPDACLLSSLRCRTDLGLTKM